MDIADKRIWLRQHGRIVKRGNYGGLNIWSVLWKSNGGVYFRGQGKDKDMAQDSLYNVVREGLYQHIVNL